MAIGIAVVFALQGASFTSGSKPTADPVVYITAGLLSLLAAFALLRKKARPAENRAPAKAETETAKKTNAKPPITQRAVESAPIAFVAGIVLNIIPGTFPIVAMKDIAQLDASNGAKVAAIVGFYLIMFAFVEVPIIAYLLAPERTTAAMNNFNAWLGRNGRRLAAYVLAGIGLYLSVRASSISSDDNAAASRRHRQILANHAHVIELNRADALATVLSRRSRRRTERRS